jgi:Protein of unknown function (DUF1616)
VRGQRDLRMVAWAAALCAVLALLTPWEAASLVFAVPLALVLPGYAIVAAAFAGRELDGPRRAVLSVALSLATLALGALVLNYVPGGIRGLSWAALLVAVVLAACRMAAVRRKGKVTAIRRPRLRLSRIELGLALGGLTAVVAALVLASATLTASHAVGFTELWILPVPGSGGSEARVGVRSEEQTTTGFDLGIAVGRKGGIVRHSFSLAPGESRVFTVGPPVAPVGPAAPVGRAVPVVATLLLDADPRHVYRRVNGSLVVPGAP